MDVDLMGYGYAPRSLTIVDEHIMFQEATAAGLLSLEHLVSSLSPRVDCQPSLGEIADQAISMFRRIINILDLTSHTRFRWDPIGATVASTPPSYLSSFPSTCADSLEPASQESLTLDFTKPSKAPATASVTSRSNSPVEGSTAMSMMTPRKDMSASFPTEGPPPGFLGRCWPPPLKESFLGSPDVDEWEEEDEG